jgi:hypothetical protein
MLNPELQSLLATLDLYRDLDPSGKSAAGEFEFEANRACYAQGQTRAVVRKLLAMIEEAPRASYSMPAASLVLDTYVMSKEWEKVDEVSDRLARLDGLGDAHFAEKLKNVGADAYYERMLGTYQKGELGETRNLVERYLKRFPRSPRAAEALLLASRAALDMKDPDASSYYLNTLLSTYPESSKRGQVFLFRAGLEEEKYEFEKAVADYEAYLAAAKQEPSEQEKREAVQRRILPLKWLARQPLAVDCGGLKPGDPQLADCSRYAALVALRGGAPAPLPTEKIQRVSPAAATLWAAVALQREPREAEKYRAFKERQAQVRTLAAGWEALEPMDKASTIPLLTRRLPQVFASLRRELRARATLSAKPQAIAQRAAELRELESTGETILKLPWAGARVAVLAELAEAYREFSEEITRLRQPRGMSGPELAQYRGSIDDITRPLDKRAAQLRRQARELAVELVVSPRGIVGLEPEPGRDTASVPPAAVDLILLRGLEPQLPASANGTAASLGQLKGFWAEAVEARNWGRAAFFLRELETKAKAGAELLGLLRAISLYLSGAETEALAELEAVCERLAPDGQEAVNKLLLAHYRESSSSKKAKHAEEAIRRREEEARRGKEEKEKGRKL